MLSMKESPLLHNLKGCLRSSNVKDFEKVSPHLALSTPFRGVDGWELAHMRRDVTYCVSWNGVGVSNSKYGACYSISGVNNAKCGEGAFGETSPRWRVSRVALRLSATPTQCHCSLSTQSPSQTASAVWLGARLRFPTPIRPKINREESSSRRSRIREVALTRLRFFQVCPGFRRGCIYT